MSDFPYNILKASAIQSHCAANVKLFILYIYAGFQLWSCLYV